MRVKFLDQAKTDLMEHNQYYREVGGVALASKMLAQIKAPVLALKDNPEIAQPYELAPGIRRLVVARGAFLVFYRVSADIEVLHIRRSERMPVSAQELESLSNMTE
jgi:plasmid stabilization system protein ParE